VEFTVTQNSAIGTVEDSAGRGHLALANCFPLAVRLVEFSTQT